MLFNCLSVIISIGLPLVLTARAFSSTDPSYQKQWLQYWVILALSLQLEKILGAITQLIPFYTLIKCTLALWLMVPEKETNGSNYLFEKYVYKKIRIVEYGIEVFLTIAEQLSLIKFYIRNRSRSKDSYKRNSISADARTPRLDRFELYYKSRFDNKRETTANITGIGATIFDKFPVVFGKIFELIFLFFSSDSELEKDINTLKENIKLKLIDASKDVVKEMNNNLSEKISEDYDNKKSSRIHATNSQVFEDVEMDADVSMGAYSYSPSETNGFKSMSPHDHSINSVKFASRVPSASMRARSRTLSGSNHQTRKPIDFESYGRPSSHGRHPYSKANPIPTSESRHHHPLQAAPYPYLEEQQRTKSNLSRPYPTVSEWPI